VTISFPFLAAAYPIEMVNMVLADAQPKVVIVSPTFHDNVKDAAMPVLQLVPGWEDSLMSSEEAATALTHPVMVCTHSYSYSYS
jgi:hypothetical protein